MTETHIIRTATIPSRLLADLSEWTTGDHGLKTPMWFGSEDRPLFGWIEIPPMAKAALVLCPPIGIEALLAHRTYRTLAEQCSARGIATLRFDYYGTGDSGGDVSDVASIATWMGDIQVAIRCLRSTGFARVGAVGMRIGADLLAQVSSVEDVQAMVLWDPCVRGRRFLREQTLLASIYKAESSPVIDPSFGVEIPGMFIPRRLQTEIEALDLTKADIDAGEATLLLTRTKESARSLLEGVFDSPNVSWKSADGQPELIEAEFGSQIVPEPVIAEIADFCAVALIDRIGFRPEQIAMVRGVDMVTPTGVTERPVSIGSVGLFGILSERETDDNAVRPAIVLLNSGRIPHSGPGRFWVELARMWATYGFRVFRVDLSGLGDSPVGEGQNSEIAYPDEAMNDIGAIITFLAPDDPTQVTLVGSCAGGYHAVEGALRFGLQSVIAINSPLGTAIPDKFKTNGDVSWRQAAKQPGFINRVALRSPWLVRFFQQRVPSHVWWMLDRLRLYRLPTHAISDLAKQDTDTLLVFGREDADFFIGRARNMLPRLVRSGRVRYDVVDTLDHALFDYNGRTRVAAIVCEHVLTKLRSGSCEVA